jgi:outer membrane protein assembly factor BamA
MKGARNEILPDSLGSIQFLVPESREWNFSLAVNYNTLDDPISPRNGVHYRTQYTTGRKKNLGPDFLIVDEDWKSEVNTRRIEIDAEILLPVLTKQILYFGLHGREVRTGDTYIPVSDQIRFGGTRTIRGYDEDAFRGHLAAWMNNEYRYLIGRRSWAFIFCDIGHYERKEKSRDIFRATKLGYGFGIRLETRIGLLGVDFGLGEGDSLLNAKIHVGLMSWF